MIDNEDHTLDLLFYHRKLRRLVAVELKLGRFRAAYKGQMELYFDNGLFFGNNLLAVKALAQGHHPRQS
jgi:hypothetical protein